MLGSSALGKPKDQLFKATDVNSKNILHFSFASFQCLGRLPHWNFISLPPVTFLGLLHSPSFNQIISVIYSSWLLIIQEEDRGDINSGCG